MNDQVKLIIKYTSLILIGFYILILSLIQASSFLIPIVVALLLAMVMLPVSKKLEDWKVPKVLAVLIADLLLFLLITGLFFIVGVQVKGIADDWPQYEAKIKPEIEKVQNFIEQKTGISIKDQIEKQTEAEGGSMGAIYSRLGQFFSNMMSFFGNLFLVFVYMFFFMLYRKKFVTGVSKFFEKEKREGVSETLEKFANVTQRYLFGRFILIIILTIVYTIGLSIIGIRHAIVISLLAAVLSIIPYVGNIAGFVLAFAMSLLTKDGFSAFIGILIVFTIGQSLENIFLQPFVIGREVNLNPVLVIVGVVAGGAIWGITGMIIIVPLLAMVKVLFDTVEVLNPLGYLLGEEDTVKGIGIIERLKRKVKGKAEDTKRKMKKIGKLRNR